MEITPPTPIEEIVTDIDIAFTYGPPVQFTLRPGDELDMSTEGLLILQVAGERITCMLDKVVWYSTRQRTRKAPADSHLASKLQ